MHKRVTTIFSDIHEYCVVSITRRRQFGNEYRMANQAHKMYKSNDTYVDGGDKFCKGDQPNFKMKLLIL